MKISQTDIRLVNILNEKYFVLICIQLVSFFFIEYLVIGAVQFTVFFFILIYGHDVILGL